MLGTNIQHLSFYSRYHLHNYFIKLFTKTLHRLMFRMVFIINVYYKCLYLITFHIDLCFVQGVIYHFIYKAIFKTCQKIYHTVVIK